MVTLSDTIKTRIKQARVAAGYKTQQAFADALDISRVTIARWESGTHQVQLETLEMIAKHTNREVYWFLMPDDAENCCNVSQSCALEKLFKNATLLTNEGREKLV